MTTHLETRCEEKILTNYAFFQSLLNDIAEAKQSIDLETYIFNADVIGEKVAQALTEAAKRGVKVRVLVDGAGTPTWGGKMTAQMEAAGVETRVFHPLPWKLWHWGRAAHVPTSIISRMFYLWTSGNKRNHRKTCMIDKEIVYVGSANITKQHVDTQNGGDNWRDTNVRLTHVETKDLEDAFNRAWNHVSVQERVQTAFSKINIHAVFRLNYFRRQRRTLYKHLIRRIKHCKERIWITNAYFVPDDFLLRGLKEAAKKGVDVRILLPHQSDIIYMPLLSTTFYTLLVKEGVAIYEYLPSLMHAKIMILDNWFCVGSSNFNSRSLLHDLEIDVHIHSEESKAILTQQFLDDLNESRRISLDDLQKQPIYKRILGRLLLLVRHWS